MTSNLYEQAIAEAKQLKEMAEQNAKNKIIEAVTPRIKALIEAQILGEQDDVADDEMSGVDIAMMTDDEESEDVVDDTPEEEVLDLVDLGSLPEDELLEPPALEDEMSDEVEHEIENTSVTVNAQGDVNISVAEGRGRNRVLSKNTRSTTLSGKVNLTENCNSVRRQAKRMDAMLQGLQFNKLNEMQRTLIKKAYQELLSEALLIKRLLLQEGANNKLTTSYKDMIKEIKKMTRRSSAIFRRLFEIDEMADEMREEDEELAGEEEMADEMGDEDVGGEADVDVDAASSALEDLGVALGLDVEVGAEEGGEEEMDDEMSDEEEEEIDLGEIHLGEADEEDEEDEGAQDEVYEIDENILRREIRRLRRLRESEGVDAAVLDDFGGGDDEGDAFVDVDEDDLINALADELGSVPKVASESRRRRFASRRSNRRAAKLQTENKKLRKQLSEMNLFNAKLLYVNKLMQNRNVTQKQQRAIVEALDNAKTIREAKFLYQGLAKSLVKKGNRINESTNRQRLLSSASKPTRRGSAALNEDAVASRWATLAGIKR
tara:strand:+ start:33535 stop:35175 length:1641 start_codon:yes stop_codon:yes gene_type:complete